LKFTIAQSALSTCLSQLIKIVPNNPSHPIMGNILVKVEDEIVTLSAFDLSTGLKLSISAEVQEPGELTFPARLLSEIVSKLSSQDISIATDESQIELKCGRGKYKLQGLPTEDFPDLPTVKGSFVSIPAKQLRHSLASTLFASSTEETKQILMGVNITFTGDRFECAATDGHRLSVATNPDISLEEDMSTTIPAKALSQLNSFIVKLDDDIQFCVDQSQIVFKIPTALGFDILTCRVLDGTYPAYRQLIPNQFSRQLTCARDALLAACDRISVIAAKKNNIIVLKCTADVITIAAEAADIGSGFETIEAQLVGSNIDIGFNVKYLIEGLKAIASEFVLISMNEPTQPAIVSPVSGDKFEYLLMPIQIRS
jgi:DNA polymerase III subunit beta